MAESSDWRNLRWEATHQRIFSAALDMFEDFGFDKVSVGQIARRAGVSVPTFYAHYPSKEHLIMALPTAEQVDAMLATQPEDRPLGERLRRALPLFLSCLPPDVHEAMFRRWRIIAATPSLRTRAAEFERETAEMIVQSLAASSGRAQGPTEVVQAGATLVAYTAGLLAWADSNGERKLDEALDEAFEALDG